MILAAVIASILFALFYPQPSRVVLYLYACLYGDLVIFAANQFWGDTSKVYAVAYAVMTGLILLAIGNIVLEAVRTRQNSYKALGLVFVLSVTLGRLCFAGLGHQAHYYDFIGIIEGAFLFGAGLTIGYLAPYLERTSLGLTLACLWLGQSFWRLGFYLHVESAEWLRLNWRIPPLLGILGFSLLGWLSRRRIYAACRAR